MSKGYKFDPAVINEALNIRDVADHYGADLRKAGHTWMTCCILPDHSDSTPSFAVYPDTNHFYCYGCQVGGDPLKLIALCQGLDIKRDFRRVLEIGADLGGVAGEVDEKARIEARRLQAKKRADQEKRQQAEDLARMDKAFNEWLALKPVAVGDVAYQYLKHRRGIDLSALPRWPEAMRFKPDFAWKRGPDDPWQKMPAIVTALTRGNRISAVHVTALEPDGSDVARWVAQKGRLVKGSVNGASMRLHRGETLLRPSECFERHGMVDTLALTEGLEDALSVALLMPEWRVWSAYSLDNIGRVRAPECAAEVVICADNDEDQAALAALKRVKQRQLKISGGRTVRLSFPPAGYKDFNSVHEVPRGG